MRPIIVAPFTGAWIEINRTRSRRRRISWVAPFTGAWIEMRRLALHSGHAGEIKARMGHEPIILRKGAESDEIR